jgi:hypothetical protein
LLRSGEREKNAKIEYQKLWDELERLGAHRTQLSVWLVSLDNTPSQVDHFKQFVDCNDRLWVTKIFKSEHTYSQAMAGTKKWLDENPPETR